MKLIKTICLIMLGALVVPSTASAERVFDVARGQAPQSGFFDLPATPLRGADAFKLNGEQNTLVILFQPECPWCVIQFREADKLRELAPDVSIIGMSLKGSRRDLVHELRKARTKTPSYISSPGILAALNHPDSTPRIYLVSDTGDILAARRGKQNADALLALLNSAKTH